MIRGCFVAVTRPDAIGSLSVDCPHCKALVRFDIEQIERRRIVLAH